jgi:hypothetical protein
VPTHTVLDHPTRPERPVLPQRIIISTGGWARSIFYRAHRPDQRGCVRSEFTRRSAGDILAETYDAREEFRHDQVLSYPKLARGALFARRGVVLSLLQTPALHRQVARLWPNEPRAAMHRLAHVHAYTHRSTTRERPTPRQLASSRISNKRRCLAHDVDAIGVVISATRYAIQ